MTCLRLGELSFFSISLYQLSTDKRNTSRVINLYSKASSAYFSLYWMLLDIYFFCSKVSKNEKLKVKSKPRKNIAVKKVGETFKENVCVLLSAFRRDFVRERFKSEANPARKGGPQLSHPKKVELRL